MEHHIKRGTLYILCGMEDDTPMFGRIVELIMTTCQECLFITCPLHMIAFQFHYHAYELCSHGLKCCVPSRATVRLSSPCMYKGSRRKLHVCLHQVSFIFLNFDGFYTHAVYTCEQICQGYNLCVFYSCT